MLKLIDVVCPSGHIAIDVFVRGLAAENCPDCKKCGAKTERLWAYAKAPGITPQGTRTEINTDGPGRPKTVDIAAIAAEKSREVADKWLRYSDDKVAEQHVSREINERAGITDAQGNEKPVPTYAPLTFDKPSAAEFAV